MGETLRQIYIRKIIEHREGCEQCSQANGLKSAMCSMGRDLSELYAQHMSSPEGSYALRTARLTWGELALASLGLDDDKDELWVAAIDEQIAQRCEMIWAMSEVWWLDNPNGYDWERKVKQ